MFAESSSSTLGCGAYLGTLPATGAPKMMPVARPACPKQSLNPVSGSPGMLPSHLSSFPPCLQLLRAAWAWGKP